MAAVVQPGVVLADKFRVERLLGEGGMGAVVAAHHLELDRLVALKFMLPQALAFPQAAHRFMRESRVLERFQGENTTRIVDKGILENGAPYFAMEFVDGIDLAKLVRQYGALSVKDSVDFVLQACAGMAEAHARNIVHRDLKPGNLILTQRPDGSTLIKVLDFGLSKIMTEEDHEQEPEVSQTQTTGTMGTPAYMSPEQARSAKYVDARADIWSLGAILFHLTSAGLPFPAQATAEAFAKLLYDEPVSLREAAPWVPAEVEAIVLCCLRKDPDERYQSVAELVAALQPFGSKGCFADAPPPDHTSVIVDGPKDIDVPSVLQQRTTISFDSMKIAISRVAHPELFVELPDPVPSPSRSRSSTWVAALAGMIAGAAIIVGALLFLGRNHISAAEDEGSPGRRMVDRPAAENGQSGQRETSKTAADQSTSPSASGGKDDGAATSASGSPSKNPASNGQSDPASGDTSNPEQAGDDNPEQAGDDGEDSGKSRKRRGRRRNHHQSDDDSTASDSQDSPKEQKIRKVTAPDPDPFGTMH